MAISLTPSAADRVKNFLTHRGHGVGLRLGVKATGCSGYAYVVNYADEIEADSLFRIARHLHRLIVSAIHISCG